MSNKWVWGVFIIETCLPIFYLQWLRLRALVMLVFAHKMQIKVAAHTLCKQGYDPVAEIILRNIYSWNWEVLKFKTVTYIDVVLLKTIGTHPKR